MTIKLNSLARWALLPSDEAIVFEGHGDTERTVRISFNLEAVTTLFLGDEDGGENLLVTAGPGLETVEFNVAGSFKVYAEKGSGIVHYLSAEMEPVHFEVPDPKIFTRIAQRRHRNPEVEEMMARAQMNMERRFAQLAAESDARQARLLKEISDVKSAAKPAGTPAVAGEQQVPAQVAAGEKPGETPPAPVAGEQQGGGNGGTP